MPEFECSKCNATYSTYFDINTKECARCGAKFGKSKKEPNPNAREPMPKVVEGKPGSTPLFPPPSPDWVLMGPDMLRALIERGNRQKVVDEPENVEGKPEPSMARLGRVQQTIRMRIDCPHCDHAVYVVASYNIDRSCGRPAATCGPGDLYKEPPYEKTEIDPGQPRPTPPKLGKVGPVYIRVTKCTGGRYWYGNRIGEVFEVVYKALGGYVTNEGTIDARDCEVVEEEP